jgi:Protein of unknown function (DUF3347)
MKKIFVLLIVAVAALAVYWFVFKADGGNSGPAQQPLALKKHSEDFNKSMSAAMGAYFEIKNAFVDADTVKVKEACKKFIGLVDGIKLEELKKDTAAVYQDAFAKLGDIKANAGSILLQTDITEMRHDFNWVSDALYPFFTLINYEGPNLYWQNCPMAFGEGKEANWISNTTEIINPYLGKNHPEFKGTMLHCGEIKDTIKTK